MITEAAGAKRSTETWIRSMLSPQKLSTKPEPALIPLPPTLALTPKPQYWNGPQKPENNTEGREQLKKYCPFRASHWRQFPGAWRSETEKKHELSQTLEAFCIRGEAEYGHLDYVLLAMRLLRLGASPCLLTMPDQLKQKQAWRNIHACFCFFPPL